MPRDSYLEMYKRADGKWAWRLRVNGEIVATDGGQGYENREDCRRMGVRVINGHYASAPVSFNGES